MKLAHLTLALAIALAAAGCATENVVAAAPTNDAPRWGVSTHATDVPLLYVVDGVRLQRDQVPSLTADQVLSVSVVKGRLALQKYGPDAAYGVVIIRTRAGATPQA